MTADLLPIVFAPGLLCDERVWGPVGERLQAPSRVVSLVGASSIDAMADAILAAAPQRCVLAGFSMGGMAALRAAARAPDRLAAVVICATHAETDDAARVAFRRGQIAAARTGGFAALAAALPTLYFPATAFAAPTRTIAAELVLAMARAQGAAVFARHVGAILHRPDLAATARRITVPTRIVCGADDPVAPPDLGRRLAALIPGAELSVLQGCCHMLPLEAPDAIAALLDTLARQHLA